MSFTIEPFLLHVLMKRCEADQNMTFRLYFQVDDGNSQDFCRTEPSEDVPALCYRDSAEKADSPSENFSWWTKCCAEMSACIRLDGIVETFIARRDSELGAKHLSIGDSLSAR